MCVCRLRNHILYYYVVYVPIHVSYKSVLNVLRQFLQISWHMRRQCVPGSLFSAYEREPGDDANDITTLQYGTSWKGWDLHYDVTLNSACEQSGNFSTLCMSLVPKYLLMQSLQSWLGDSRPPFTWCARNFLNRPFSMARCSLGDTTIVPCLD